MKRMRLTILFLAVAVIACSQDPEQWIPGLTKLDSARLLLHTTPPGAPASGYFVNVNGYPLWFNGVSWDTLNTSLAGSGGTYYFGRSLNESAGVVTLDNDQETPGIYYFYGTNGSGSKAWAPLSDASVPNNITITNLNQVTNRSHTDLSDIGTNTHAQIDNHISSTLNPHLVTLNQLGNPTTNKTFTMGSYEVGWAFTNPSGGMYFGWEGDASENLFRLDQNTGNPGGGTHLLDLDASDADILPLSITGANDTSIIANGYILGEWRGTAIGNSFITNTLTGKSYNGVTLTNGYAATLFLNGTGAYSTPFDRDSTFYAIDLVPTTGIANQTGRIWFDNNDKYLKMWDGSETDTLNLHSGGGGGGSGTVTTVAVDNGLTASPSPITSSGTISMGTPSTLTLGTTNLASGTTHTHALNIADFTSFVSGLAPASGGGTTNFLRADGIWTIPPGADIGDSIFRLWQAVFDSAVELRLVAHRLVDTLSFPFGFGLGNPYDTASCKQGALLGKKTLEQDTTIIRKIITQAKGSGVSFGVAVYADPSYMDATPAYTIWSGTVTTSKAEITSGFTNQVLPPDLEMWCEITSVSTPATHAIIEVEYTKKRGP